MKTYDFWSIFTDLGTRDTKSNVLSQYYKEKRSNLNVINHNRDSKLWDCKSEFWFNSQMSKLWDTTSKLEYLNQNFEIKCYNSNINVKIMSFHSYDLITLFINFNTLSETFGKYQMIFKSMLWQKS